MLRMHRLLGRWTRLERASGTGLTFVPNAATKRSTHTAVFARMLGFLWFTCVHSAASTLLSEQLLTIACIALSASSPCAQQRAAQQR